MATVKRDAIDFWALRLERDDFEARYGVKSACLADAFRRDGRLVETDDFVRWSHIHLLLEKYGALAGV